MSTTKKQIELLLKKNQELEKKLEMVLSKVGIWNILSYHLF